MIARFIGNQGTMLAKLGREHSYATVSDDATIGKSSERPIPTTVRMLRYGSCRSSPQGIGGPIDPNCGLTPWPAPRSPAAPRGGGVCHAEPAPFRHPHKAP